MKQLSSASKSVQLSSCGSFGSSVPNSLMSSVLVEVSTEEEVLMLATVFHAENNSAASKIPCFHTGDTQVLSNMCEHLIKPNGTYDNDMLYLDTHTQKRKSNLFLTYC